MRNLLLAIGFAVSLAALLGSCSGGTRDMATGPGRNQNASEAQLRAMLYDELAKRGIDPAHAASMAPQGTNAPKAELLASAWSGDLPDGDPGYAHLSWSFKLTGDYDDNGVVSINDISPLGKELGSHVDYLDPADPDAFGRAGVPVGNPNDPQDPNQAAARADGDVNGEVNISDIQQIAAHFGERYDGWRFFRKDPGSSNFVLVEDPSTTGEPLFLHRPGNITSGPYGQEQNLKLYGQGTTQFRVAPYDSISDAYGPMSETLSVQPNQRPTAAFTMTTDRTTVPATVTIDASASSDPEGSIQAITADFGAAITSAGPSDLVYVVHTPGDVPVTVTVEDGLGLKASATQTVHLDLGGANSPDWTFSQVPGAPVDRVDLKLAEINGGAGLLQAIDRADASGLFYSSADANGAAWSQPAELSGGGTGLFNMMCLAEVGGRPAVSSLPVTITGGGLDYWRALDAAGSAWPYPVNVGSSFGSSGMVIRNGLPLLMRWPAPLDLNFKLDALDDADGGSFTETDVDDIAFLAGGGVFHLFQQVGNSLFIVNVENDWEVYRSDDDGQTWITAATVPLTIAGSEHVDYMTQLEVVDGKLAGLSSLDGGIYYRSAKTADGSQWNDPVRIASGQSSTAAGLAELNGMPAMAYADGDAFDLRFAAATDTEGQHWPVSQVVSNIGSAKDCSLAVIGGRPAIAWQNRSTGQIEYAIHN